MSARSAWSASRACRPHPPVYRVDGQDITKCISGTAVSPSHTFVEIVWASRHIDSGTCSVYMVMFSRTLRSTGTITRGFDYSTLLETKPPL